MVSDSAIHQWENGSTAAISRGSPLGDSSNEDAVQVVPCGEGALVLVVADGMGGLRSGELAARIAIQAVEETLNPAPQDADMRRLAIMNGFDLANERVQALGVGAGTTLAVLEIDGCIARPYHAGDSFMLVVGQRGKIRFQNVAHSPVGYALESGLIDEDEAMHHDDRNITSNMVGSASMSVDVGPTIVMSPRDTAVIASDGVSDNIWVHEIVDRIRVGSLEQVCHAIESLAQKRMVDPAAGAPSKPDDMTFALFRPARVSSS